MTGTSIGTSGGGGKIGDKAFVKGSRGVLFYVVREDVAQSLADKNGGLMPVIADSKGRIHVKDAQIQELLNEIKDGLAIKEGFISDLTQSIKDAFQSIKIVTKTVSCPKYPMRVPGIGVSAAYETGDTFGTIFEVNVPPSGTILSATFWDMDDEGLQTDFEIFKDHIPSGTDNAAWAPTDISLRSFVTELAFFAFDDHGTGQTSEIKNIGKAYTAPKGKFWIQGIARGAQNIAAENIPRFQLQILSDDPNYQEG